MKARLYLKNPYLQQFTSAVLEQIRIDGKPGLILEETAFYPSAGGQPHDSGTINDVAVVDVFENDRRQIVHLLETPVVASCVTGKINWQRRFDHMQQHTGQHLLSQAFIRVCRANTISFHLGEKDATIDLDRAGFDDQTLTVVEDLASQVIYENRKVMAHTVDRAELDRYPVRNKTDLKTSVRLIEIDDFDFTPCGGTHCFATGEVGILKIGRFDHYKGGTRIHFLCGLRAVKDYQQKTRILKKLSMSMSTGESALPGVLQKMRQDLTTLRGENDEFKKQVINFEAQALSKASVRMGNIRIIKKIFADRDQKELKLLAKTITANSPDTIILFGTRAAGKATLLFMHSGKVSIDMSRLMESACPIIRGRGGGRPQEAQGGGSAAQSIEQALQEAMDKLNTQLLSNPQTG